VEREGGAERGLAHYLYVLARAADCYRCRFRVCQKGCTLLVVCGLGFRVCGCLRGVESCLRAV